MATYTSLNQTEIVHILSFFEIGQLHHFEVMKGGNANSSFLVTTQTGQYTLSVCDEKSIEEITILTSALEHLNQQNYPTAQLIKTKKGEGYIVFMEKPVYIKTYVDGVVEPLLDTDKLAQIGSNLATLHHQPTIPILPTRYSYGFETFDEILDNPGEFSQWLQKTSMLIKAACSSELPSGFIHGDLFFDNVLFKGGRLVAVLDFEEACNYYFVFDLGMCAAGSCTKNGELSMELTKAFIKGYQSKRPLTEIEKNVLQHHIIYGATATAFWRYRQYNIIRPGEGRENDHLEMVALADQVASLDGEYFKKSIFD